LFKNRREAAYILAAELEKRGTEFDIVLGVPRGGVVIAEVIASCFSCPMDIIMARKIGSPDMDEYAIGAVAPDGGVLIHERVLQLLDTDRQTIDRMAMEVLRQIEKSLLYYRKNRPEVSLKGKRVLLTDDGIATGFTLKAAVRYLKRQDSKRVVIAAPVSARNAYLDLREEVDEIIVLEIPERFYAVSQFYEDFSTVEDTEVIGILKRNQA